jgi:hypothetical protein
MIHQVPSRSIGPISAGAAGLTVQYCTAGPWRTGDCSPSYAAPIAARGAARAVAAEYVVRGDDGSPARRIDHGDTRLALVLLHARHPRPVTSVQCGSSGTTSRSSSSNTYCGAC